MMAGNSRRASSGSRGWAPTKWALAALAILVLLVVLDVALLAFPYPAFRHQRSFGSVTVASDRPLPAGIEQVLEETRARLAGMGPGSSTPPFHVFLCQDPSSYRFFTFLARLPARTQGFSLSIPRHVFLNATFIRRMALPRPGLRHWRFEGSLAGSISHELAHFEIERERPQGRGSLDSWKLEGYADFLAQRAAMRADSTYELRDRIGRWADDEAWSGHSRERHLLGWQLLVEYLVGVKGLGLEQIADASVTEAATREAMLEWYRAGVVQPESTTE